MDIKKNDVITLEISSVTSEGSGIGKHNGMAVFVPGTAQGDIAEVLIIKVKKTYAIGKLTKIISPSEHRITPDCKAFPSCGGCVYRHISYDEELAIKHRRVSDCIERIGGFKNAPIMPIVPSDNINEYRNKAQLPVGASQSGRIITGFYANHTHRIVECPDCKLHNETFTEIARIFTQWANENSLSAYDERTGKGILRHLYIRHGEKTGEIMVCVVANSDTLPHSNRLIEMLTENISGIKSIILNTNRDNTNVILGKKCQTLYGADYITDKLLDLQFKLSPLSFYQVNRSQAEKLYSKAIEYASLSGKETVLDLFCGTGTIGLCASRNAGHAKTPLLTTLQTPSSSAPTQSRQQQSLQTAA